MTVLALPLFQVPLMEQPPAPAAPFRALRTERFALVRQALASPPVDLQKIAGDVTRAGLSPILYTRRHAAWEAWFLSSSYIPWPAWFAHLPKDPGAALTGAILAQAMRDLRRGMPCTIGLSRLRLCWPSGNAYLCRPNAHACAAHAITFLLSLEADALYDCLGIEPDFAHPIVLRARAQVLAAMPFLTLPGGPNGHNSHTLL